MNVAAPNPIDYLDAAARVEPGDAYKRRLIELMDIRPGQSVLDIGCGPGTDLPRIASALGGRGAMIGVDHDPKMVAEARRRLASLSNVTIHEADAHLIPLPDCSVDRARFDRVLQHLRDPCGAIVEARRVLRSGGLVAMAEPDWDTLTVADEDVETSRRFARFTATRVLNPTIGRQLAGMAAHLGLVVRTVEAVAVTFRDFETADLILGLRRNTERGIEAGAMRDGAARSWLERLDRRPFLAGFTFYLVTAQPR